MKPTTQQHHYSARYAMSNGGTGYIPYIFADDLEEAKASARKSAGQYLIESSLRMRLVEAYFRKPGKCEEPYWFASTKSLPKACKGDSALTGWGDCFTSKGGSRGRSKAATKRFTESLANVCGGAL